MPEDYDHPRPTGGGRGADRTERIRANASHTQHNSTEPPTRGYGSPLAPGFPPSAADTPTRPTMRKPAGGEPETIATPSDFSAYSAEPTRSAAPVAEASPAASWSSRESADRSFEPDPAGEDPRRQALVRGGVIAGIAAALLLVLYLGDLMFSSGTVPRGTVVADVEIGGLDKTAAEKKLREHLGPDLEKPVVLEAAGTEVKLNPQKAGLGMDWKSTVERAGEQPLNPFTRLASLFEQREVTPVSTGNRGQLNAALEELKPQLDREATEGTIRFEGANPVAVDPVKGRAVDIAGATEAVLSGWLSHKPVQLPATEQPVSTTPEGVHKALDEIAKPAVSAPVTVPGEGKQATLSREAVAGALTFEPDGKGGLKSTVDIPKVIGAVEPQLRDTIHPGKDAEIVLENNAPAVHPSIDGRGVDWNKTFERLPDVLKQPGGRVVPAIYTNQPAKFTTDQANQLGIKEVVSQFTTGGFEPASGVNIKRAAEQINGAVVKPNEVFSLNGYSGPRGLAQGYIESGVIENGVPARDVGGGISQLATTLFNASYFAGMKDVEHKAHSFYISRYPMGREATVFQNPDGSSVIDVKFRNVSNSGIMITTQWTPSSVTVRFWGTKQFDVTSETGPQTDPTPPQEKSVPPGAPCSPSKGDPGFTVTDTRTIRNLFTGQVIVERPTKTKYDPHPIINCPPPPPPG